MKTKILIGFILISSLLSISNLNSQNIIQTSFYSQSLQKTNNVNIFLPSCYDSETSDYPVIYYLHGWGGSENSANLVMQLAETYINNGTIEPVIIVCANNQSSPLLGSFYVNSELNGDYEDYMTQELTTWIEDNYRVKSGKNYRSLMGQSMGGYGSFRLAILHKDLYRGIAAHGSAINFDLVIDDIKLEIKNENGPGPDYFYNFSTTGLFTKMIFAMAGAFSPNSASGQNYINPAIVEFPFDEYGNIIDSVYQKFSSNDPTNIIGTLLPSDSVAILFGAGRNDNLHLFPSNFAFKDTLEYYGLDYEYVDHYGTHNMPTLFRQRGLIFLDSIMSSSTLANLSPATLPFIEDWETQSGEQYTNGQVFSGNEFNWAFETNLQGEGRVRWGTNTFLPFNGNGALTMDRNPTSGGNYAINYTTLTLDLSNYTTSSNLELSFWWADHKDENNTNDKVWIRGSETDSWVIIYDFDPMNATDDTYQLVDELDIDDVLASASQTVSSSFQLRFGQEDDCNTVWDGISIDDIVIEDKASCASCLEPSNQSVCNITETSAELSWTENCSATTWEIRLDTVGFDTTNYSPVLVDTLSYTWTGISENTNYDWYIRAVCGSNQFSSWVGPNTFSGVSPFELPFIEDWETQSGEQYTNGQVFSGNEFNWAFETNLQGEGRVRWGTNTFLPFNGNGALTMDRNPTSGGNYAINYTTLTLDLSNYTTSSNLELSFWWADHKDEESTNDKVWIRGSETDSWVLIYDFNPMNATDDTYQLVDELDIDDVLASASQTVSSSFQLRFGQEDDCNTVWDGLSFDDIKIEDKMPVSLVNVRKEPYLIYEGKNTEMTVLWQLDDSASSLLEWGTDLNYQSGNIISNEYSNDHQHSYKIPNLSPATKYYYNVISGENEHDGSFVSAPDTTATEVSFFAYGDHRTFPIRHDSVVKNIIDLLGDSSNQTFILSTGDLVSSGDIEQDWDDQLFDPSYSNINQLLHSLPFQATMGNHERDGILFAKYLPYEFAGGGGLDGNYYSFDYGNVHITIINQYTDYSVGSDQHNWLISDLSSSTKPWKIIALHEPGWAAGYYPNNTDVQDIIQPLCETYSVQMVFAGHVHYYSRASVNGVIHITTGGGGSNLYDPEDGYPNVDTAVKAYHFCKIDISGDTLRLAAIDQNGDTIDNFSLENNFKSKQIFPDDDSSINDFKVYAYRDKIYIKSIGDSKNYPKTIIIYDAYGRKMNELYLSPSLTNEIPVKTYSGNTNVRLVKVVTEKKVSVSKVFVNSN